MLDKIILWHYVGLGIYKFAFFNGFETSKATKVIFLILPEFWYFVGFEKWSVSSTLSNLCV